MGSWVGVFFGAPELFVWDASGFRGTQTRVVLVTWDYIWTLGPQSFRYPRVLCSLWLLHSGCARTPHTLGSAAEMLSCGTAMAWRGSAQGSWGCLAAPPHCSHSQGALFPIQSAIQPLSG